MDALPDQKEYECIQNGDFCSHWLLFGLVSVILILPFLYSQCQDLVLDLNLLISSTIVVVEKNLRLLLFFILYA